MSCEFLNSESRVPSRYPNTGIRIQTGTHKLNPKIDSVCHIPQRHICRPREHPNNRKMIDIQVRGTSQQFLKGKKVNFQFQSLFFTFMRFRVKLLVEIRVIPDTLYSIYNASIASIPKSKVTRCLHRVNSGLDLFSLWIFVLQKLLYLTSLVQLRNKKSLKPSGRFTKFQHSNPQLFGNHWPEL